MCRPRVSLEFFKTIHGSHVRNIVPDIVGSSDLNELTFFFFYQSTSDLDRCAVIVNMQRCIRVVVAYD